MGTLLQDLRYSLRQLGRNPGSSVAAVISLALGIGATTAVFSVIYAALMNPYPYPTADRIVRLTLDSEGGTGDWANLNGPQIRAIRQTSAVESVIAMDYHGMTLTGDEVPENVDAIGLIANGFSDLGVPPALGRGLLPSDAIEGQEPLPVVVLSYKFWQKHYFSNPDVLGKTLQLDRKSYAIVGVAAPRFTWYVADVYLPLKLTLDPGPTFVNDLLLKPGVTPRTADAELQPVLEQFARDDPKQFPPRFRVHVEGLNEWVKRGMSGTLYLLFGAVGMLLAIGCCNVSILLIARGMARRHELAVRTALGARRGRLVRQLLTESLLLAFVGAALGVCMAYGILAGMQLVLPRYAFAPEVVIRINVPVMIFSAATAVFTGVLFGLWPAVQLSSAQPGATMNWNTRRTTGGRGHRRTYNALIAAQAALTLQLLTGAGSATAGFIQLLHTPLGYEPHNVISVGIPLRDNSFTTRPARAAYFEQLLVKAAETPGVTMAAISENATPPRNGWNTRFQIPGQVIPESQTASVNLVSQGYFATLHIPLLEGRLWTDSENHNGALVAVINRTLAQRYFPNGDALGHSIRVPGVEDRPPERLTAPGFAGSWLQIVGIVGDACNDGLRSPVKPGVYMPWTLSMGRGTQILVRSEQSPLALIRSVQKQLAKVNPEQQTYPIRGDLETWVSDVPEWQQEHLTAWIFSLFAVLALVLAAVGLYSVVSWTAAQRTNELGIRIALGAQRGDVLRIVCTPALASVAIGIAAGLALTFALNRMLQHWIPGHLPDPKIVVLGALLFGLIAALASWVPARHAAVIDPGAALRFE